MGQQQLIEKRKRKKKAGRPSKADLEARRRAASSSPPPVETKEQRDIRRSLRRRSFRYSIIDYDEDYLDDDDDDNVDLFEEEEEEGEDEEDEEEEREDGGRRRRRREKKVKLVVKLSSGNSKRGTRERVDSASRRGGRVAADSEEERDLKKRRINGGEDCDDEVEDGDCDGDDDENGEDDEGRDVKVESQRGHSIHGTPIASYSHPLTPLPDKKLLELILDKLQKKDTYGVYAEPVDPEELPDYHDIIEHPMDFSTVRKKLANGSYSTLEQFESDIFLISSNARQYNAPETIYHKQARAIKELAERKFQRVRTQIERLEKELKSEAKCEPKSEPKPEQRERPNMLVKKLSKKPSCRSTQEPVCSDFSSGATLATIDAQNTHSADHAGNFERHSNNDGPVEGISFLVDNCVEKAEDLHSGKGVLPKFGKRSYVLDESRATYHTSNQPVDRSDSIYIPFEDEKKQLIPVGLPGEYSYACSLTHFAANLGPIAWRLASRKIEQVLPPGFKYGRGWVGEYEPLPTTVLVLKDHKEYPLASRLQDAVGSGKIDKRPECVASGRKHMSNQPSSDGKVAYVCGSGGAKPPSPAVSVAQRQNLRRASGGPENMMLRGPGLNFLLPNNLTNDAAVTKRMQLSRDSVCAENIGPHRVEQNSPSVSNQKTNYVAPRQTPGSREMDSREMEPNFAPLSSQKTDHVTLRPPSGGMETPSRHGESMHDGKNFMQSFSFKPSDSNVAAPQGLRNGRSTNSFVDSNRVVVSSPALIPSQLSGAAAFFPQKQDHGLSDPVLVMKMLTEKAQRQQSGSGHTHSPSQVRPSIQSPRGGGGSNAAAAAASAWMSVGAVGYRPAAQMPSGNRGHFSTDLLHSGKQVFYPQAVQSNVEYPVSTTMHFQPEKNGGLPFQAFVQQPVKVSNEPQNQNRSMAFPPMGANDLLRFQVQASWRGVSPHTQQKQKQDTLPPDLNVAFQSVDSQQPDLALQL